MAKCDNCIHKQVCKYRPPKSYPQFMIRVICENCKHFIDRRILKLTGGDD